MDSTRKAPKAAPAVARVASAGGNAAMVAEAGGEAAVAAKDAGFLRATWPPSRSPSRSPSGVAAAGAAGVAAVAAVVEEVGASIGTQVHGVEHGAEGVVEAEGEAGSAAGLEHVAVCRVGQPRLEEAMPWPREEMGPGASSSSLAEGETHASATVAAPGLGSPGPPQYDESDEYF